MSNFPVPPDPPPGMDPQIKSILTSILLAGASAVGAWAAGHGLIDAGQQTALVNILVTVAGAVGVGLIGWWKARNQSPPALIAAVKASPNGQAAFIDSVKASPNGQTALIAAVNTSDNGLKVVKAEVPAPTETQPVRGPK